MALQTAVSMADRMVELMVGRSVGSMADLWAAAKAVPWAVELAGSMGVPTAEHSAA